MKTKLKDLDPNPDQERMDAYAKLYGYNNDQIVQLRKLQVGPIIWKAMMYDEIMHRLGKE
jgi:hypothetical protein